MRYAIRVTIPVHTFVMMADDAGDFCIVIHLGQDALADLGMELHLTPLL